MSCKRCVYGSCELCNGEPITVSGGHRDTIEVRALSTYMRRFPVSKEDGERGYAEIDVYRVQLEFGVTDPCLIHAIKKLLCPGQRSGGKSVAQDVAEAAYSLKRWAEMRAEEDKGGGDGVGNGGTGNP